MQTLVKLFPQDLQNLRVRRSSFIEVFPQSDSVTNPFRLSRVELEANVCPLQMSLEIQCSF